jgi:hypothetical protein
MRAAPRKLQVSSDVDGTLPMHGDVVQLARFFGGKSAACVHELASSVLGASADTLTPEQYRFLLSPAAFVLTNPAAFERLAAAASVDGRVQMTAEADWQQATGGDTLSVAWFGFISSNRFWGLRAVKPEEAVAAGDVAMDTALTYVQLTCLRLSTALHPVPLERADHHGRPLGELQVNPCPEGLPLCFALPAHQTPVPAQLPTVEVGLRHARLMQGLYVYTIWLYVSGVLDLPPHPAYPVTCPTVLVQDTTIQLHLQLGPGDALNERGFTVMSGEHSIWLYCYAIAQFKGDVVDPFEAEVVSIIMDSFAAAFPVAPRVRYMFSILDCMRRDPDSLAVLSGFTEPEHFDAVIQPLVIAAEAAAAVRAASLRWTNEPGLPDEDVYWLGVARGRSGDAVGSEEDGGEEEEEEGDDGGGQAAAQPGKCKARNKRTN